MTSVGVITLCEEFVCFSHASGSFYEYPSFLPQSKDVCCRVTGISKLFAECESVCECVCVMGCHPVQGVQVPMCRISGTVNGWMNGWMDK